MIRAAATTFTWNSKESTYSTQSEGRTRLSAYQHSISISFLCYYMHNMMMLLLTQNNTGINYIKNSNSLYSNVF